MRAEFLKNSQNSKSYAKPRLAVESTYFRWFGDAETHVPNAPKCARARRSARPRVAACVASVLGARRALGVGAGARQGTPSGVTGYAFTAK